MKSDFWPIGRGAGLLYSTLMKSSSLTLTTELVVALCTWLLVAGSALGLAYGHSAISVLNWILSATAFLGFMLGFFFAVRDERYQHDLQVRLALLGWQFVCVLTLYLLLPYAYNAILMTMLSMQVVYYISLNRAIVLSPLWSLPLWLTQALLWEQSSAWLTALLFWSFNIFAMMMMDSRRREEAARESAEAANRELVATQAMLQRATREQERTRIARNIHDLLGHHLTALAIHLQVAQRQAVVAETVNEEHRSNLDRCHKIARLLLQDVREAVSDMRDNEGVSLQQAIAVLTQDVPALAVKVETAEYLPELSFPQANAIIKAVQECITNTLRHAGASHLDIAISHDDGWVKIVVQDNGRVYGSLVEGNGLKGMRERISEVAGRVHFEASPSFITTIEVPVNP